MKKLLLFAGITLATLTNAQTSISQIRWGSTAGPLDGLTIDWTNIGKADKIRWGYTEDYEMGEIPAEKRNGMIAGYDSFFHYAFPVMKPNSTIYYQLFDSRTKTWQPQRTYKTVNSADTENFKFIVQGDSRDNMGTVWKNISQKVLDKGASFTLFTGDITNSGNNIQQYRDWFSNAADYVGNNIVYHSQGNHDVPSSVTYYQNIFSLPKNNPAKSNLYYSFRYGNALFISLNSEDSMSENSAQSQWLKSTLENAKNDTSIKWRIVFFHRSLVNAGRHYGEANARRSNWGKWFDDYNVDLVLNGHDHNYQRTHPLNFDENGNVSIASGGYGVNNNQGICQMICGGSGAGLYSKNSNDDVQFTSTFYQGFNYVLISIEGSKLTAQTYVLGSGKVGNEPEKLYETTVIDKSNSLGTKEVLTNNAKLTINENPVLSTLQFTYASKTKGDAKVFIHDMSARLIKTLDLNKNEESIKKEVNVSDLKPGIYNLSIVENGEKQSTIFIKK